MGVATKTTLDVYTTIQEDGNDPLAIITLIAAPLALLDATKVSRAASIRWEMTETMGKLGVRGLDHAWAIVKKVTSMCLAR
jgi:hypothetical protein